VIYAAIFIAQEIVSIVENVERLDRFAKIVTDRVPTEDINQRWDDQHNLEICKDCIADLSPCEGYNICSICKDYSFYGMSLNCDECAVEKFFCSGCYTDDLSKEGDAWFEDGAEYCSACLTK